MKKIIGIIHPFDAQQTFYVYQDGNKLEIVKTSIDEIPNVVFNLSKTYDISQIDLSGAKHFSQGIKRKIEEIEIEKYNKNNLTIRCI